jgi:hypothetical protein
MTGAGRRKLPARTYRARVGAPQQNPDQAADRPRAVFSAGVAAHA